MSNDYQPVSCQLHSEIELHAMHGTRVKIKTDASDPPVTGQIIDVVIHDKAEYVIINMGSGQSKEIRLDKIINITPL